MIKPEYFGERAKTTQACLGLDVSSLYLSNFGDEMLVGPPVRRREANDYRLERVGYFSVDAIKWVELMGAKLRVKVQHALDGGEKKIGGKQLPFDDYAKRENGSKLVFQFSGCFSGWFTVTNATQLRMADITTRRKILRIYLRHSPP